MWTIVENLLSPSRIGGKRSADNVENDCGQMCTNAGYATSKMGSFALTFLPFLALRNERFLN